MPPQLSIAVLISGSGRTLKNLIQVAESDGAPFSISLVISSAVNAGGLSFARAAGIESLVVQREDFESDKEFAEAILTPCRHANVDYVVMAGFVKFLHIPPDFENRVINIHPALLPAFGGKGMYGGYVHKAVIDSGVRESGCTVHFADNEYDHGPILHQRRVPVLDADTPQTLAARVFDAELAAYPYVLRALAAEKGVAGLRNG